MNAKQIHTFFRTYKYEIIATVVNLILAYISFRYFRDNIVAFLLNTLVLLSSLILVLYFKTRDRDFYDLPLNNPSGSKDWVGRGKWEYVWNENCFEITDSHVGHVFPKTLLWDDYSFEFDFKIVSRVCGWIVRAANLSNYVMLQCDLNGINPHVRIDGQWVRFNHNDPSVSMTFRTTLSPDMWYKARIICEKRNIRVILFDGDSQIFDRNWNIPDYLVVTYTSPTGTTQLQREIDLDFGAVGFRNSGSERGFIKNVYIQKL